MNKKLKSVKVQAGTGSSSPIQIKISSITKQLELLNRKKSELFVFSKRAGVIGSVNVKVGEDASPFTPLITMHDSSPSLIKGFVHESIYNKTFKGQKVVVTSISDASKTMDAVVASVGNRIIEYPVRLRKSENSITYGREVVIFVSENNPFLIGEKVQIKSFEKSQSIMAAHADTPPTPIKENYFDIGVAVDIENVNIEPSGLLFIKDLNQSLVISDDTGKKDRPYIYTMNDKGEIDKEIEISGVKGIADMEAITQDENGFIYIASSMSEKKNGKVSKKRKRFLKIERKNFDFRAVSNINLFDALNDVAVNNHNSDWAQILLNPSKSKIKVNIEGIIVKGNTLFFGLRSASSKLKDQFVLIRLNDLTSILETEKIQADQVSIQANSSFPKDDYFKNEGVSDMAIIAGELYVLTVNNNGKEGGRVLKTVLEDPTNHLEEVKTFRGLKPEGITFNSQSNKFIISFDQGKKTAQILVSDKL